MLQTHEMSWNNLLDQQFLELIMLKLMLLISKKIREDFRIMVEALQQCMPFTSPLPRRSRVMADVEGSTTYHVMLSVTW